MISDDDKLGSAAKQSGAIACDQQAIADSSQRSRATQIQSLITNLAKRNSMQYKQAIAGAMPTRLTSSSAGFSASLSTSTHAKSWQ